MILVFDASALLAQAKAEPGAAVVDELLIDTSSIALAHAVNLCEVYYKFLLVGGRQRSEETLQDFERLGLRSREDIDPPFWRSVGRIKASIPQAALADSFAMALARRTGGTVVTADHPAFEQAAAQRICQVTFIR